MKSIILILFFLSFFGCRESKKTEKYNNDSIYNTSIQSTTNTSETSTSKKIDEKIVWDTKKIGNFTFNLPNNFYLQINLSNYNKKVYICENEALGLTIDIADLPNGYENSAISEMILNLNDFGNSINRDNRQNFDDFRLINTKYSHLGNVESVEVSQSSTKVSGKNVAMIVKNHFVISNPYYCSITFSYPINSISSEGIIKKIETSFSFPEKVEKNNAIEIEKVDKGNEMKNKNRPSIFDTKKWILDKFKAYGNPDFIYKIVDWDLIIVTTNNPKTSIEYTIPLCNLNVYKNTSHTFSSERITFSTTTGRIKINRNLKGFPHFNSSFDFDFRFSSEDSLIKRLNDALENLNYYCPDNTNSKETF